MGVLIILSVLELCVTISCAVLGIKSLKNREKTENMGESEKSEQAAALLPWKVKIVDTILMSFWIVSSELNGTHHESVTTIGGNVYIVSLYIFKSFWQNQSI